MENQTPSLPAEVVEEWRPIPDFEGFYEASSLGGVRRIWNMVPRNPLKPSLSCHGYWKVVLCVADKKFYCAVHVLVCKTFGGPKPTQLHEAAHIDGCRTNNRADNLAWKTRAENNADRIKHGTLACGLRNGKYTKPEKTPRGMRHGKAKLTDDIVIKYRPLLRSGALSVRHAASEFGVSETTVVNIRNGKTWAHI